jgi:hypothetical protein
VELESVEFPCAVGTAVAPGVTVVRLPPFSNDTTADADAEDAEVLLVEDCVAAAGSLEVTK